ncbi:glycosyltransferase [Novosphingobium sp. PASSN1]|uniref:glycosyltransferase n=1 Tax=Novosphingobium sp. PASSN1 TaxID=2015561 RepID=UPI000BD82870|nr:glycosyltransferase [Novosphingobium sp. PASSN1]OYU35965.1 MAG: glycosyl transferase [Novosphingobium sp. PASSN1]
MNALSADISRLTPAGAQPLRVLTFLHAFEPGGVERVALRLHEAWRAQGLDARLVMGRTAGAMKREWPGLEFEVLGSERIPSAAWETLWMIFHLPRAIRRIRPDVLFCAGNSYTIVAVMMRLLLGRACPPIVAKISNDLARQDLPAPARPFYRAWLRIQGRMLDRLVGMAPPMREEIGTLMRADDARIAVIDDPSLAEADIRRMAAARDAAQAAPRVPGRRFLAIGRLAAQKNFPLLLDAFARIAGPDDRLAIIGEGSERRALEAQAQRLGLSGKVRLPGHVSPLDAELAAADALVLSSDYEGVPAVVAEALAAGLPVVSTRCSVSMDDMLVGGRFGTLVPVGDVAALAEAMDKIANLQFDVCAARDQARRFTVEIASHRYRALMEGLAHA